MEFLASQRDADNRWENTRILPISIRKPSSVLRPAPECSAYWPNVRNQVESSTTKAIQAQTNAILLIYHLLFFWKYLTESVQQDFPFFFSFFFLVEGSLLLCTPGLSLSSPVSMKFFSRLHYVSLMCFTRIELWARWRVLDCLSFHVGNQLKSDTNMICNMRAEIALAKPWTNLSGFQLHSTVSRFSACLKCNAPTLLLC